jgi:hypothetical protein
LLRIYSFYSFSIFSVNVNHFFLRVLHFSTHCVLTFPHTFTVDVDWHRHLYPLCPAVTNIQSYIHTRMHPYTYIYSSNILLPIHQQFLDSFYFHFFTFPLLHFAHSSADSKTSFAETNTYIYTYTERETTKRLRSCLFTSRLNI